jgi:uncharacterized membrane protein YkvA (DUF1232 family)
MRVLLGMKAMHLTRFGPKLYRYMKDPEVPTWRKLVGVAALAYLVSPIDLIPDFIPFVGYLDDAGVLTAAALFTMNEVRKHAEAEGDEKAEGAPA